MKDDRDLDFFGQGLLMQEMGHQIFGNLDLLSREVLPEKYPDLSQLVARRTTPGILIFTATQELTYINAEAHKVLTSFGMNGKRGQGLAQNSISVHPDGALRHHMALPSIPEAVTKLCDHLKLKVSLSNAEQYNPQQSHTQSALVLFTTGSDTYTFRGFFLSNHQRGTHEGGYILVLIERVSPTKKINLNQAAQRYELSKREIEVVKLLIRGHTNKEIADRLCVSVYTIEDHIKKIMIKMEVTNRTSILAKLLES